MAHYTYGLIDKVRHCAVLPQKIKVRGNMKGFTAEITATIEYHNDSENPIEAMYVMPLDEEAAVCSFQATIDGSRTIVAEVKDKQEALDTYDDAIASGHVAFLLDESESSDIFLINVGNLPPKTSAMVEVTFVTQLSVEKEGRVVFVLPTVLNPRYTPRDLKPSVTTTMPNITSVINKYSFDFEIQIESATAIKEITSPSHRLNVDIDPEDNKQALVRLEEYGFDADVQVHVLSSDPFTPSALVENGATKTQDGDAFMSNPIVMLNFFPEFDSFATMKPGEFIFIVDRSGSMMRDSRMGSARETLVLFLKSLPYGCYFNVIGFGSSFQKLFPKSELYNDATVDHACSHAQTMKADLGGTDILRPLKDVYSQPLIEGYPRQIFLLTDGEVFNTEEVVDLVAKNADKARCFSFGIDSGASTALIKGVARAGKGKADFIRSKDRMQSKVIKMLKIALCPPLECTVDWDLPEGYSVESGPHPLPTLKGDSLVLYGFLTPPNDNETQSKEDISGSVTISVTAPSSTKDERIQYKVSFQGFDRKSEKSTLMLHRLAAKALIQSKYTDMDSLKEEIIRLSISANVVSKLTSFVGVDKESHEPIPRPMVTPHQEKCPTFASVVATLTKVNDDVLARNSRLDSLADSFVCSAKKKSKGFFHFNPFSIFTSKTTSKTEKNTCHDQGKVNKLSAASSLKMDETKYGALCFKANSPLQIVSLQKACGSWLLTSQLASICEVTLDKLEKACPVELTAGNKESVWATAVALSGLERKFGSKKDEWEIVADKGRKWLEENLKNSTLSYDQIMKMAANVLGNMSP